MTSTVETAMVNSKIDAMYDAVWPNTLGCRLELPYEQALRFIERIDQYNNFDWMKVHQALDLIDKIIPRADFGEGNPNTGNRMFTVEVGRERSPVIYIERYEFNSVRTQPPLTEDNCKKICHIMEAVAEADEATFELEEETNLCHFRKITFRFWWD